MNPIIQDAQNKIIIPYAPSAQTGTYGIIFECLPDVTYSVAGVKCGCALLLTITHQCDDITNTNIKFDVGEYRFSVVDATNTTIFKHLVKIFPNKNN